MRVCPRPQHIEGPVGAHVEPPGRVKWSESLVQNPSRVSPLFTAVHSLLLHFAGSQPWDLDGRTNARAWCCHSQLIASQRHVGVLDLYGLVIFWGKK